MSDAVMGPLHFVFHLQIKFDFKTVDILFSLSFDDTICMQAYISTYHSKLHIKMKLITIFQ